VWRPPLSTFLSWARSARPFPYTKQTAGSAMAVMYLVGGLTTLLAALLPHPSTVDDRVLLVIGATSPAVAATIQLHRDRLPAWTYPWFLAGGTCIVTALTAAGGGGSVSVSFSFFYMWIVMYSLLFFPPIVGAAQVVVAAAAYGAVLATLGSTAAGFTAVEPVVLVAVIATTSAVVLALSRARESSEVDPLTRVANRRGLDRVLDRAMEDARLDGEPLVLAMIDVDRFKRINDLQGHHAGDLVLQHLVREWRAALRAGDTLGRYGGDEFLVVLPRCPQQAVDTILERLRSVADDGVTCSVGAARWQPGDSASMLMSRADSALYEAKRLGRDRVAWAADDDAVQSAAPEPA
jgi:diguanylate cyclase (GGDEF)-like protein